MVIQKTSSVCVIEEACRRTSPPCTAQRVKEIQKIIADMMLDVDDLVEYGEYCLKEHLKELHGIEVGVWKHIHKVAKNWEEISQTYKKRRVDEGAPSDVEALKHFIDLYYGGEKEFDPTGVTVPDSELTKDAMIKVLPLLACPVAEESVTREVIIHLREIIDSKLATDVTIDYNKHCDFAEVSGATIGAIIECKAWSKRPIRSQVQIGDEIQKDLSEALAQAAYYSYKLSEKINRDIVAVKATKLATELMVVLLWGRWEDKKFYTEKHGFLMQLSSVDGSLRHDINVMQRLSSLKHPHIVTPEDPQEDEEGDSDHLP